MTYLMMLFGFVLPVIPVTFGNGRIHLLKYAFFAINSLVMKLIGNIDTKEFFDL